MIQYCMGALHLSEGEGYRRIAAARMSRRYPAILSMLEDGRLHLCGIGVLSKHLKDANYEDLLARATHKTKREIEILVAELNPKPDVPPTIRKRPQQKAKPEPPSSSTELRPDAVEPKAPATKPEPPRAPEKPATVEPLSPSRFKVGFTASVELRDKLRRLERLMPDDDLASIIDAAISEKLERLEARRFAKTNKPRKNLNDADTSAGVRGISAPVRRFVWQRDRGQCTFVASNGRRCPERYRLEFHHDEAYGLGGDRSAGNVRLLCTVHNLYMAEKDYGKEKMDDYRRSGDCVREPAPSFELRRTQITTRLHLWGFFRVRPLFLRLCVI